MGKKLLVFLILLALLFVGYTKYNRMITLERGLTAQWILVESQYRHKADVVLALSKSIGEITEDELFSSDKVRKARNRAVQIKLDTDDFSETNINQFRAAHQELVMLQQELLLMARQSPEINDNQSYRELITELDGTEIRIANERRRLNEQVDMYNKYINGFFNLAIAQVFGFREWPAFLPITDE